MKILHILEDYSINSGGIRTVVKELNKRLNCLKMESYILSSKKENEDNIYLVKAKKVWFYSDEWTKRLENIHKEKKIDVIHIHGVWMYPQYIAAKFCLKNKIPFALTPHGMYEPWIWNKGKLKKKLYFNLLTKKVFSKAKTIHGITNDEIINLKRLLKSSCFYEIPNLINVNKLDNDYNVNTDQKYFLYVGRLDPKKGIDLLIKSFAKLNKKEFMLKIAGPSNEYKTFLEKLVKQLKITGRVEFLGLIKGEEKKKFYKEAYAFVAPSYSEVIGMVNLEAAINKTPVITTHQTGLNKKWNTEGGILINPNKDELLEALREVSSWSVETRNKQGDKLYNFVVDNYSWEKRINDWNEFYKDIVIK